MFEHIASLYPIEVRSLDVFIETAKRKKCTSIRVMPLIQTRDQAPIGFLGTHRYLLEHRSWTRWGREIIYWEVFSTAFGGKGGEADAAEHGNAIFMLCVAAVAKSEELKKKLHNMEVTAIDRGGKTIDAGWFEDLLKEAKARYPERFAS